MSDQSNQDENEKPPVYRTADGWFVATPDGPHGPLASESEAEHFRSLLDTVSAARSGDYGSDDGPIA